jgi:hypothetical protein
LITNLNIIVIETKALYKLLQILLRKNKKDKATGVLNPLVDDENEISLSNEFNS